MEEILNEWQNELHGSVATFHRKAAEVAKLDLKLLDNADKVGMILFVLC
jgi:hypothetical protein